MSANYKIPIKIIELDKKSFHLLIEAKINKLPVNLILDTGASRSVFDKSLPAVIIPSKANEDIRSAGISAENIDSQHAVIKSFKLGKLKLKNFQAILIDLEEINKLYRKVTGKQIHGLLGSDFLLEMNAVINYGKSYLVLKRK
jgi:hypothetical protein